MNLKLSLIALMMLGSLSAFCQYPLVKTIGKDTVVIMTLKQGEDINKQFKTLGDSLQTLNVQDSLLKKKLFDQQAMFRSEIVTANENVAILGRKLAYYQSENDRIRELVWKDKKAAKRTSAALTLVLAGWTILISHMLK